MTVSTRVFWRWIAGFATVSVAAGIGIALVLTIVESPQRGMTLVEVLKLFLAWPAIVGGLCLGFGVAFHTEIRTFIQNIATIRVGNTEILSKQAPTPPSDPRENDTPTTPDGSITLTPHDQAVVREAVEKLRSDAQSEKSSRDEAIAYFQKALQGKHDEAIWWWFRYLDLFLVVNTKQILAWVAVHGQVTKELVHEEWQRRIPSAKEREIILTVLLQNQLLEADDLLLHVTEAGQAYLQHVKDSGGAWMLAWR